RRAMEAPVLNRPALKKYGLSRPAFVLNEPKRNTPCSMAKRTKSARNEVVVGLGAIWDTVINEKREDKKSVWQANPCRDCKPGRDALPRWSARLANRHAVPPALRSVRCAITVSPGAPRQPSPPYGSPFTFTRRGR